MPRAITPKQRRFIKHLLALPEGEHVQAARLAGYAAPAEVASRLLRTLASAIEETRQKSSGVIGMTPADVIRGLEQIAQDVEHRDRYNALKTLASVLRIDAAPVNRDEIRSQILDEIQTLRISDSQHPQLNKASDSKPRLTRTKPV